MTRNEKLGRALLLLLGIAAIALLIHDTGGAEVLSALAACAHWLPVVMALEALGATADTMVALSAYGEARVPRRTIARGALATYVCTQLLPGGRAVGEVIRATLASKHVGRGVAATSALLAQGSHVIVVALTGLTISLAVPALDPTLRALIMGSTGWTLALGTMMLLAPRSVRLAAWLAKRMKLSGLEEQLPPGPRMMSRTIGWAIVARAAHATQAALVVVAVLGAVSPRAALASEGIQLMAASLADAVPGQTGVLEGAYRTFSSSVAGTLDDAPAHAVTMALLLRVSRLSMASVGALALVFVRAAPVDAPASETADR